MAGQAFSPRQIRQILLIALLVILGWILLRELFRLLPAFLGALTLYLAFNNLYRWFTEKKKIPGVWAAAFIIILAVILIFFPFGYAGYIIFKKMSSFHFDQNMILNILATLEEGFYDAT